MSRCCWEKAGGHSSSRSCRRWRCRRGPRAPRCRRSERCFQPAHRCGMGRRRQHFRGRRPWQRSGRQVQQQGRIPQVLGLQRSRPGLFGTVLGIAVDTQGKCLCRRRWNKRIQVFDNNGTFKTQYTNVGTPAALCISPGRIKFLYSSNSNPPDDIDVGGEIYKLKLDGTMVGRFGRAGKLPKEFGTVNAIDCRKREQPACG